MLRSFFAVLAQYTCVPRYHTIRVQDTLKLEATEQRRLTSSQDLATRHTSVTTTSGAEAASRGLK